MKGLRQLDYQGRDVQALVRLHGEPLGWIKVENERLPLSAREVAEIIAREHTWPIYEQALRASLASERGLTPGEKLIEEAFQPQPRRPQNYPLISALVLLPYQVDLTWLPDCLKALHQQDHPNFEIVVGYNGAVPKGLKEQVEQAEARLVSGSQVFYRAASEAQGEFIAITGPMAAPDKGWLRGVADATDNPEVAGVVGLMAPLELETEGQLHCGGHAKRPYWFNRYYNYGQVYELSPENFGTPLNCAFQRNFLLEQCNNDYFALDFGFKQMLFLYYRALKLGKMVGYEPRALVWERFPQDYKTAVKQVEGENRERAEFLAMSMRWERRYRKVLWQKLKESPATRSALTSLLFKNIKRRLKGDYAGSR